MSYTKPVQKSADILVGNQSVVQPAQPAEQSRPVPVNQYAANPMTNDQKPVQQPVYQNNFQQFNFTNQGPTESVAGILDLQPEGHGFLRPKYIPSNRDIYISQSQIRRFTLRPGDLVAGLARPPKDNERYYGLLKVEKINDVEADTLGRRPYFDD